MTDGVTSSSPALWIVALGASLVLVLTAALLLWWWLRRRRLRRLAAEPRPRGPLAINPVVLVHGLLGFDEMRLGPWRTRYFRGVAEALTGCGVQVYRPRLPPLSSVAERARCLAAFVDGLPHERVNLVAHSMGGLDARYAVAQLGLARAVCSITTVGSPHHGTPLADVGTGMLLDKLGLRHLLRLFDVQVAAFYELTVARMALFNTTVADVPDVACGSVVAAVDGPGLAAINRVLAPCYLYLRKRVGANDGLVPRGSQRWGDVLAEVEADHLAQIGWSSRFDARALYVDLVSELRGRGL